MVKKVIVLCPGDLVTGGPEALHQLVHVARSLGFDASIAYEPSASVVPLDYRCYDIQVADVARDDPETLVVAPEVYPWVLRRFPRAKKIFWWLSWDYGAPHFESVNHEEVIHACQSHYAYSMLRERLVPPGRLAMLSDFTRHPGTTTDGALLTKTRRANVIAFNPAKGMEFMFQVIEANPDLIFAPIRNMTSQQVQSLLRSVKVYADFGPQPGKDRIPREAAAGACCVLTASDRGASAFFEDLPIPSRYKFPTRAFDPLAVGAVARDCLKRYRDRVTDFELYRERVSGELPIFTAEVREVLSKAGCVPVSP